MPLVADPRNHDRVVRLNYSLVRPKKKRKDANDRNPYSSQPVAVFRGRCPKGHVLDPRCVDEKGKVVCRVCVLASRAEKLRHLHDEPTELDGDWRFWPIDCLPGLCGRARGGIHVLQKRGFVYCGELIGLNEKNILCPGMGALTATAIVKLVRRLTKESQDASICK